MEMRIVFLVKSGEDEANCRTEDERPDRRSDALPVGGVQACEGGCGVSPHEVTRIP